MGAAGKTRAVRNQLCNDFEMLLGTHLERFLGSDSLNFRVSSGSFPGNLFHPFLRGKVLQQQRFRESRLLMIRGLTFSFLRKPYR